MAYRADNLRHRLADSEGNKLMVWDELDYSGYIDLMEERLPRARHCGPTTGATSWWRCGTRWRARTATTTSITRLRHEVAERIVRRRSRPRRTAGPGVPSPVPYEDNKPSDN